MLLALTSAVFALVGAEVLRSVTWYLAAWQYGFLTFAQDLAHGVVFNRSAVIDALRDRLPVPTDTLFQTYIWDGDKLYCRYAPGFPTLLALVIRFFGRDAVHYVNPALFLMLLALLGALGWRLFRSAWLAAAVPALVFLFPTYVFWWALTPMPDIAAHLAGLVGVYVILQATKRPSATRVMTAGFALGCAVSIRPDALLYLVPAGLIVVFGGRRNRREAPRRAVLAGAALAAFLAGVAPLLLYNWAATGNPLRSTQSMEIESFFSPAPPTPEASSGSGGPLWHGGSFTQVQGGGLRLANLRRVLPQNVSSLRRNYGDLLLVAAAWGALLALVMRPLLFIITVPYIIIALLFFSCWGYPDARFLAGIHCLLPLLILQGTLGTLDLLQGLIEQGWRRAARGLGIVVPVLLVFGGVFRAVPNEPAALPILRWLLVTTTGLALLAAAVWRPTRVLHVTAPVLLLALTVFLATHTLPLGPRARFQRPESEGARTTFARAVDSTAVVITSEDAGRPAENIAYYAGIPALYLTDLRRWRLSVDDAAGLLIAGGFEPYVFIRPSELGRDDILAALAARFHLEKIAVIPPSQAIDYFVAAAAYPRGIGMELYRVSGRPE